MREWPGQRVVRQVDLQQCGGLEQCDGQLATEAVVATIEYPALTQTGHACMHTQGDKGMGTTHVIWGNCPVPTEMLPLNPL